MKIAQTRAVGLIGVALLVGSAVVGCGGDDKDKDESSSATSSATTPAEATTSAAATETSAPASPAAEGADYRKLLLKAADIDPSFTDGEPMVNPQGQPGIAQTMTNAGKNQLITFVIMVTDGPEAATASLKEFEGKIATEVDGAPTPADVGDGGFVAAGKSPDGAKEITEVYFTQGKALVNIEFSSNPNDPVPAESALQIAKMQDTQIKNNLT